MHFKSRFIYFAPYVVHLVDLYKDLYLGMEEVFMHLSSVVLEIYVPLNSSGAVSGLENKTIN